MNFAYKAKALKIWILMAVLTLFLGGCSQNAKNPIQSKPYFNVSSGPMIHPNSPDIQGSIQSCVFPKKEDILPWEPLTFDEKERMDNILERWTHLDAFWSQEYIGADLLREELIALKLEATNHLVRIIDIGLHGEKVSQLIAGSMPSAIIPQNHPINSYIMDSSFIIDIGSLFSGEVASLLASQRIVEFLVHTYEDLLRSCQQEPSLCPSYIGVSLTTGLLSHVIEPLAKEFGNVFVVSIGNESKRVSESESQLVRQGYALLVGSLDPLGNLSDFSDYSTDMTISVPSDYVQRSYDFQNKPVNLGATSGAQPLVTGSLAAFTKITGHSLNQEQATKLLQKTAVDFPRLPPFNIIGTAMLNAYKIGRVAFKLKEACQNSTESHECISSRLSLDETYDFDLTDRRANAMADAQKAFPSCFLSENSPQDITCEAQRDSLKELRRIAFLNPSDSEVWQVISCIHREKTNLIAHADFYNRLANRENMSDQDIIDNLLADRKYELLVNHHLPHITSPEYRSRILTALLNDPLPLLFWNLDRLNYLDDLFLSRAIEDIMGEDPEDIPNYKNLLIKALGRERSGNFTFISVYSIIFDHFDSIEDPVEFITRIITQTPSHSFTCYQGI